MKLLPIYHNPHATGCFYKSKIILIYTEGKLMSTNFGMNILDSFIKNYGFKPRKPYEDIPNQ